MWLAGPSLEQIEIFNQLVDEAKTSPDHHGVFVHCYTGDDLNRLFDW